MRGVVIIVLTEGENKLKCPKGATARPGKQMVHFVPHAAGWHTQKCQNDLPETGWNILEPQPQSRLARWCIWRLYNSRGS